MSAHPNENLAGNWTKENHSSKQNQAPLDSKTLSKPLSLDIAAQFLIFHRAVKDSVSSHLQVRRELTARRLAAEKQQAENTK